MASPQPGYPPGPGHSDQYQQDQYGSNQTPEHAQSVSPAQGAPPTTSAAARRKRQYAGQAYEFGGGANAAVGGQQQGGGGYQGPQAAGYDAYGQQPQQPAYQPTYGPGTGGVARPVSPAYGQPPAAAGYRPPDPGYPTGTAPLSPGMSGITQGMNNMGIAPQQGQGMQQRPQLNQLYPTDLLNAPFNVAELDLPPPPIILPPNVGVRRQTWPFNC